MKTNLILLCSKTNYFDTLSTHTKIEFNYEKKGLENKKEKTDTKNALCEK